MILILERLFKKIAESMPGLKSQLIQAGMRDKPEQYVKRLVISSIYFILTYVGIIVVLALLSVKIALFFLMIFPFVFAFLIFYLLKIPQLRIIRKQTFIDREIAFAGRFLSIELSSGVPLYDAMRNLAANYKSVGKPFSEIITKVDLGTPIESAIEETVQSTPSKNLRKILWQILNSLRTGTDIIKSLNAVVNQIIRQQTIEIKRYGKKLNPMAMFYMMIAIIFPTLGIVMLIVISGFISVQINLVFLILIAFLLGFIQFIFLATIKSSRPSVDM